MFFARFGARSNAPCGHGSDMLPDSAIGALNARSFGVALGTLLCAAGASVALAAPPSHFMLASYVFTVYAVNVAKLPVAPESSGAMVTSVVQDHLLGKAVFVAHYGR